MRAAASSWAEGPRTTTGVPITSTDTTSQISAAQADLDGENAGLAGATRQFEGAQASLREAEANDLKAQDDVARYKPLAAKDEIPQQQYTAAVRIQQATAAAVERALASAAAAEDAVTQARARIAQAQAGLQSAHTAPQQSPFSAPRARAAGRGPAIDGGTPAGATEPAIHDDRAPVADSSGLATRFAVPECL